MKKVVITGASGFLGSQLLNKLTTTGFSVLPITRHTTDPLNKIVSYGPDAVIHCAWKGGNSYVDVNDPAQFENVQHGIELIKTLRQLPNKPRFIGFGTFIEYGDIDNMAIETDFERPNNLYGLSKLTLKNYSKSLCKLYDMEWVWVRPCYVYGPGDVSTRLIPTVISKIISGESVLLDSCDKLVDYLFVDDFVHYVCSLVTQPNEGVYNICSGQQYRIREVVLKIGELLHATDRLHFNETNSRELLSTLVCGSNIKINQIGTSPTLTTLDVGLQKTIDYHLNLKR